MNRETAIKAGDTLAPIGFQAAVARDHALADNQAEFRTKRAALLAEYAVRAERIHADFLAMQSATFVERYGV